MILVLRRDVSDKEIEELEGKLHDFGTQTRTIRGEERSVIAVIGSLHFDVAEFEAHPAEISSANRSSISGANLGGDGRRGAV